jgi:hypothetical protein
VKWGTLMQRIVVIDDCRLTLAIARDILEEAGFESAGNQE